MHKSYGFFDRALRVLAVASLIEFLELGSLFSLLKLSCFCDYDRFKTVVNTLENFFSDCLDCAARIV